MLQQLLNLSLVLLQIYFLLKRRHNQMHQTVQKSSQDKVQLIISKADHLCNRFHISGHANLPAVVVLHKILLNVLL